MRGRRRKASIGTVVVTCLGGALLALPASAGQATGSLHPSLSGDRVEARSTIPVARGSQQKPRVALSTPIASPQALRRGDRIRVSAELQVTTTCVDESSRCVGRPYGFSPEIGARLLLTGGASSTKGKPISGRQELRCNQRRPNRNHHCVFVFADISKRIRDARRLPCEPERCFVNLVADAHHPNARGGNVVLLGADRPDGTVDGDKARLDVLVERGRTEAKIFGTEAELRDRVPIAEQGGRGRRVVYSLRLGGLRRGDVLVTRARQLMGISGLPYNVFVGTRLILAARPNDTRPRGIARRAGVLGGEVTELNGFNCTHGPSAYRDPCLTKKTGATLIRRSPQRGGEPAPLFLNLVSAGLEKLANAGDRDSMRVLDGGYLRAVRYRAPD